MAKAKVSPEQNAVACIIIAEAAQEEKNEIVLDF
jgi:hypothetical protein